MLTTFSTTSAGVFCSSPYTDSNIGGHNARQFTGQNAQVDVQVTATDAVSLLEFQCYYASGVNLSISTDGGATYAVLPAGTSAWGYVPLAVNLPAGSYHVVLRCTSNSQGWYLDRDAFLRVTTAASTPTVTVPAGFGFFSPLTTVPLSASVAANAYVSPGPVAGYALLTNAYGNNPIRFTGTLQTLKIWCYQNDQQWAVYRDKALLGIVTTGATSQYGYTTLADGIGDAADHVYDLYPGIDDAQAYPTTYAYAFAGAGAINTSVANAFAGAGGHVAFFGDSISAGKGATYKNNGWCPQVARGMSLDIDARAISSKSAYYWGQANVAAITGLSSAPVRIVFALGSNDMAQLEGAVTTSQYTTAVTSILNVFAAKWPGIPIDCIGVLPRTGYTDPSAWNAALQAGIAASTSGATYKPIGGGLTFPGSYADGIHPNDAGHAAMAAAYLATLTPAASLALSTPTPLIAGQSGTALLTATGITLNSSTGAYNLSNGTLAGAVPSSNGSSAVLSLTPATGGPLSVTVGGATSNGVAVGAAPTPTLTAADLSSIASAVVGAALSGATTPGTLGYVIAANLNASVGSRLASADVRLPPADALYGTPGGSPALTAGGVVPTADTAGTGTLVALLTPGRAANLDNLDAKVSLTASSAALTIVQAAVNNLNNLSALANLFGPTTLEVPASGSIAYGYTLLVKDAEGHLTDLSAVPTVTAANAAGVGRSANLSAVTRVGIGQYAVTYAVAAAAAQEGVTITATGTAAGDATPRVALLGVAVVAVDTGAALSSIVTTLGVGGAGLVNVPYAGPTVAAFQSGLATATALSAVNGNVQSVGAAVANVSTGLTTLSNSITAGVRISVGTGAGQMSLVGGKAAATLATGDAADLTPARLAKLDGLTFTTPGRVDATAQPFNASSATGAFAAGVLANAPGGVNLVVEQDAPIPVEQD